MFYCWYLRVASPRSQVKFSSFLFEQNMRQLIFEANWFILWKKKQVISTLKLDNVIEFWEADEILKFLLSFSPIQARRWLRPSFTDFLDFNNLDFNDLDFNNKLAQNSECSNVKIDCFWFCSMSEESLAWVYYIVVLGLLCAIVHCICCLYRDLSDETKVIDIDSKYSIDNGLFMQ